MKAEIMTDTRVREAADAMFHKLFRLFGRRERVTAEEIEEEALDALDMTERHPHTRDLGAQDPIGPGFDCAEDVRFLP